MAQNTGGTERRVIRPQVDDQFWFDTSKEMVQKSLTSINTAADKLQTLVAWLWTIYTAGAAIGLALSKLSYPIGVMILIATPSLFLIAAYCLVSMVYSPAKFGFDPRIPSEIESEFGRIAKRKYFIYKWALLMTVIAAILVASALVTASMIKQPATPNFQANLYKQEIALTGQIATSTTNYVIKISGVNLSKELPEITSANGQIEKNISLGTTLASIDVSIQWVDTDKIVHSLQRTITQGK